MPQFKIVVKSNHVAVYGSGSKAPIFVTSKLSLPGLTALKTRVRRMNYGRTAKAIKHSLYYHLRYEKGRQDLADQIVF